jgi:hypothetical protein
MNQEHIYTLHLKAVDNCCDIVKQMKSETLNLIKLWDRTNKFEHPVFSKKEVLTMMQQEVDDCNRLINLEFRKLMDGIQNHDLID